ncbi:MAG: BMC domain-containing protein [Opitutales bacterium]|nr:BMC domain-containing protein [Opitutales bacterium]
MKIERNWLFVETPWLTPAVQCVDDLNKNHDLELVFAEGTSGGEITLFFSGDASAVSTAHKELSAEGKLHFENFTVRKVLNPDPSSDHVIASRQSINGITENREIMKDTSSTNKRIVDHEWQAIGILETQGLASVLDATDAMVKAAEVDIVRKEKIGAAYVSIFIRGTLANVANAIESGSRHVEAHGGKLIDSRVISRPHPDLIEMITTG